MTPTPALPPTISGTLTLTAAVEAVALLGIGLSPNAWLAGSAPPRG